MKNPKVAAAILSVVILISIGIGSSRSLGAIADKATDVFNNGVSGDGFSIANDLNSRIYASVNLVTVAQKYLGETDPAIQKLLSAKTDLADAKTPSEKFDANLRLTEAAANLNEQLLSAPLSDKDISYRKGLMAELESYNIRMTRNEYNRLAEEYNALLGHFPANVLSMVLGIRPLEVFG